MAQGNRIVLTPGRGVEVEGKIGPAFSSYTASTGHGGNSCPKPGVVVQVNAVYGQEGGRWTWQQWDRGADGDRPVGPHIILREDLIQGNDTAAVYATGVRAFGFIPWAGCELNLIVKDITGGTGTTTAVALNDLLIVDDTTGKFLVTTGSPELEPAMALETHANDASDSLIWCYWCS